MILNPIRWWRERRESERKEQRTRLKKQERVFAEQERLFFARLLPFVDPSKGETVCPACGFIEWSLKKDESEYWRYRDKSNHLRLTCLRCSEVVRMKRADYKE